jgi:hypothetical protein
MLTISVVGHSVGHFSTKLNPRPASHAKVHPIQRRHKRFDQFTYLPLAVVASPVVSAAKRAVARFQHPSLITGAPKLALRCTVVYATAIATPEHP